MTFLENHDTGSSQGHWRFPHHALEQGYAYLLTHPGTPSVFYDHFFHEKQLSHTIRRLMDLRRRNRIHCRSTVRRRPPAADPPPRALALPPPRSARRGVPAADQGPARPPCPAVPQVKILCAERDVYAAEIDDRLIMKIGPGDFGPNLDLYTIGERSSSRARPRRRGWQPGCAWGGGSCARVRRVPDLPRGLLSWCSGLRSRVGGLGEEVLMQRGRQVGQATPYADDSGAHVGTPLTTHTYHRSTPPLH